MVVVGRVLVPGDVMMRLDFVHRRDSDVADGASALGFGQRRSLTLERPFTAESLTGEDLRVGETFIGAVAHLALVVQVPKCVNDHHEEVLLLHELVGGLEGEIFVDAFQIAVRLDLVEDEVSGTLRQRAFPRHRGRVQVAVDVQIWTTLTPLEAFRGVVEVVLVDALHLQEEELLEEGAQLLSDADRRLFDVLRDDLFDLVYPLALESLGDEAEDHDDVAEASDHPNQKENLVEPVGEVGEVVDVLYTRDVITEADGGQGDETVVDGHVVLPAFEEYHESGRQENEECETWY